MTSTQAPRRQSADDPDWKIFGETSRVRFIEPDFCHWVMGRALKEDELYTAMREIHRFAATHPILFVLCDLGELPSMSPKSARPPGKIATISIQAPLHSLGRAFS